ncbi:Crp/Fnr family transcriptional regulator [Burkholderia multivorans]|uniref:Crp/Fnr family transcriptional regulator n=1 Tax=Burkholderia multivorans TaxID=87883 RepID=UPI000CFF5B9D|nr:Crp/Fnr family transcriptional regulator [Burkholderia multivorans]MDN7867640.1 Crp/Fnr family transcriptional regulator [Burkholderia multivorans]PRE93531.1 Crp/Fnr family transcriptional regulator [Burkholderia multivorans]
MTHQTNNVIELPYALDANRFLSALDGANRSALAPHLQLCHVETGEILCDAGSMLPAVYFPVTTAVSLQYTTAGKTTLGVAEIGCEGVVCDDVVGGDSAMPRRVVVYRGGFAYRLDTRRFDDACDASPLIRRQIFMRVQIVLAQISQTLFCSRHHPMQHQLGRWLLIAHDRSRSVEIPVTHGMLGQMLGVRRETITDTAQTLQKLGLIHQHRGSVVLTDPVALASATCGCHRVIRDEARRIFAFDRETRVPAECRVHTL